MKFKDIILPAIVTLSGGVKLLAQDSTPHKDIVQKDTSEQITHVIDIGHHPAEIDNTYTYVMDMPSEISPGPSVIYDPDTDTFLGNIFDENNIRMIEISEEEDKAAIEKMLLEIEPNIERASYKSDILGTRSIEKDGKNYKFNLQGTTYDMSLFMMKIKEIRRIEETVQEKGEEKIVTKFKFDTTLIDGEATLERMVDVLYDLFHNTQKKNKGEDYEKKVVLYEGLGFLKKDLVVLEMREK